MKILLEKIWSLLSTSERRGFGLTVVIMLIGMGFEMLGVGVVLPVLTYLTGDPVEVEALPWVGQLREVLPGNQFGVAIAIGLILLFGVKNVVLGYQVWVQQTFAFDVRRGLSRRLLERYLAMPYSFHLRRNSAELIQNTANEVGQFTGGILMPLILILTEVIVVVGIGIVLLVIEPTGTIVVSLFLAMVGGLYYLLTQRRLLVLGRSRVFHEHQRIKQIQQSIGGIKEIKLRHAEANCVADYEVHNSRAASAMRIASVFTQFPRIVLEVAGVAAIALLLAVLSLQNRDFTGSLPVLGVMAAAAIRLIPSANRIISSINQLRFRLPVLDALGEELQIPADKFEDAEAASLLPFEDKIEVIGLGFSYEASDRPALSEVTFEIPKNNCVGIIGKSGSGKSTLIDILVGLLKPQEGLVRTDGEHDIQDSRRGWQAQIGYVPQTIYLVDDSIRKNVAYGIADSDIDDERVREVLQAAHLSDLLDELPDGIESHVGESGVRLSGGQRQRIGIARALYRDPSVLVFDEATSALDEESERAVMAAIRDLHGVRTVIIIAHRLTTVEDCDQLIQLSKGKVVQVGPPSIVLPAVKLG